MAPRMSFSRVGDVLTVLTRRYGLHTKVFESQLAERWPDIAGETIAAHSRPDGIRFKRLYLLVENSVWLQQLTFFKPSLLEKINAAAGKPIITDIVLRIGDLIVPLDRVHEKPAGSTTQVSAIPDPQVAELAVAYADPVMDPVLQTRLASLMSKAWARAARPTPDRPR